MNHNYTKKTLKELKTKYPDLKAFRGREEEETFLYFADDAAFDGNLNIDEEDSNINEADNYDGLFFASDLKVNGSIMNDASDYGVTLIVHGDTYADNLIVGGAVVELQKNAYIKGICLAHYNNGELHINKLECPVLINDDHHTNINDLTMVDFVIDDYSETSVDNTFEIEDLGKIFPEKPWMDFDEDDGFEDAVYFDPYTFIKDEIIESDNIESIVGKIKAYVTEQKQTQDAFLEKGIVKIKDIIVTLKRKMNKDYDRYINHFPEDINIKYITGKTEYDTDFILDMVNFEKENIGAMCIDGDLKIKGNMYDTIIEEGIILIVTGDVFCKNLIISSSEIFINGKLNVENILYCGRSFEDEFEHTLKVGKITGAKLAIIESGYGIGKYDIKELKNVFGSKRFVKSTQNDWASVMVKNLGMEKNPYFDIGQLKKVLALDFWSKEDDCINAPAFLQAVINNENLYQQTLEQGIDLLVTEKKNELAKIEKQKERIALIIEKIKNFADKWGIDYEWEEGRFRIISPGIRFYMNYKFNSNLNSLSFGMSAEQDYDKKQLDQYRIDLIYFIEKYLRNHIKVIDYNRGNVFLGDVAWVLEDDAWSPVWTDSDTYRLVSRLKKAQTETNTTRFDISDHEIDLLMEQINTI